MTTNLFTDLNETQSEAINGGVFDFNQTNKRIRIRIQQDAASATIVGLTAGNVTSTTTNTSNNTATIS
jgi:hypothetical protein